MPQTIQADLITKLKQLHEINQKQIQLIKYVYDLTRIVCHDLNQELGELNGLAVSDIGTETLDLLILSLPTPPKWTITFYGDKLLECSVYGSQEFMKPGFSVAKQKVAFSFVVFDTRYYWIPSDNESRWYVLDEQQKVFIPIDNLENRVKTKLLETMAQKAEQLIQDRSPVPLGWR